MLMVLTLVYIEQIQNSQPISNKTSSSYSDDDSFAYTRGDAKTIEQFVEMVHELGRDGLIKEYSGICSRAPDGTFQHANMPANSAKNRYGDVLPYDHSRVILSTQNDDAASDYINANFVDGYKQKSAFIATQGPLPETYSDFWRMVWEQHCLVIVMTTRVTEGGRVKCGQYWETDEGGVAQYDNIRVKTTQVDSKEDYTITSLELTNLKVNYPFQIYLFILIHDKRQSQPKIHYNFNLPLRPMKREKFRIINLQVGLTMVYPYQQ